MPGVNVPNFAPRSLPHAVSASTVPKVNAQTAALYANAADTLMKLAINQKQKKDYYEENMWVEQEVLKAQQDSLTLMADFEKKPGAGMVDEFQRLALERTEEVQGRAPTDNARLLVTAQLNNLTVSGMKQTMGIQAQYNTVKAVAELNDMLALSQDNISKSEYKEEELQMQQGSMLRNIEVARASGVIDRRAYESFKNSIYMMAAETVENLAPTDPDRAERILKYSENIPLDKVNQLERMIASSKTTIDKVEYAKKSQQIEAAIGYAAKTGEAPEANALAALKAMNPAQGVVIQNRVDAALYFNKVSTDIATPPPVEGTKLDDVVPYSVEVDTVMAKAKPDGKNENPYIGEAYNNLETMATQAKKAFNTDSYGVLLQNPVMLEKLKAIDKLPQEQQKAAHIAFTAEMLELQRLKGVNEYDRMVASLSTLKSIAGKINDAPPSDSLTELNRHFVAYDKYYPDLIRNLQRLPTDSRINPEIAIAASHYATEEAKFILEAAAYKGNLTSQVPDSIDRENLTTTVSKELMNFKQVLYSRGATAGNADFVNNLDSLTTKVAGQMIATGVETNAKKAAKKAAAWVINDKYLFIEDRLSGGTLAFSKRYVGKNGKLQEYTQKQMEDRALVLEGLKTPQPWRIPQGLERHRIKPEDIDLSRYPIADQPGVNEETKLSIARGVMNKAYWASTEDLEGVVLLTPGSVDTQPIPVKRKDGTVIKYDRNQLDLMRNALGTIEYMPPNAGDLPNAPNIGPYFGGSINRAPGGRRF